MIDYSLWEVGGKIRDDILGVDSSDIDYTVVIENKDEFAKAEDAFFAFEKDIKSKGFEVFKSDLDVFTIRSKFPNSNEVADFVIARKESGHKNGTRRPQDVCLGSLLDDQSRRDFTCNTLAKSPDGEILDPFNGRQDIADKIIRTPVSAEVSFNDDPLRILRALRFCVTKDFVMADEVYDGIKALEYTRFVETVSTERVREELCKMFRHNTVMSLTFIDLLKHSNFNIFEYIFKDSGLWLMPTTKK